MRKRSGHKSKHRSKHKIRQQKKRRFRLKRQKRSIKSTKFCKPLLFFTHVFVLFFHHLFLGVPDYITEIV